MSYICTASGKQFHFDRPTPDMVCIEDVANALGNLCRFTGQVMKFYSVAEHSIHVSNVVPEDLALCALLHDATEAYVADIARPLKQMLPDYRYIESMVWNVVAEKFGLPMEMPKAIKDADMSMLELEASLLLPVFCYEDLNLPGDMPPAHIRLRYYDPQYARYAFMERYKQLTGRN